MEVSGLSGPFTDGEAGMRRVLLAAAVALFACGGDSGSTTTDHSSSFVGTWNGSSVVVMNGQSTNSSGALTHIFRSGTNALIVHDVCGDGSGPSASVTDGNNFVMVGLNCPPAAAGTCAAVSLVINGGTGSRSNGQLTVSLSGVMTGCGLTIPLSLTFNGSRTSTSPNALTALDSSSSALRVNHAIGDLASDLILPF